MASAFPLAPPTLSPWNRCPKFYERAHRLFEHNSCASNILTVKLFMEIMAWTDDGKFEGFVVGGTTALRCPSTMRLAKVINEDFAPPHFLY